MARYSIEETTLTDIGDALRRHHGETRTETYTETVVRETQIIKSADDVAIDNVEKCDVIGKNIYPIDLTGAKKIELYFTIDAPGGGVTLYKGLHTEETIDTAEKITGFSSATKVRRTYDVDVMTILTETKFSTSGYYIEVTGLDENGNPISGEVEVTREREVPNTYSSSDMAEAIDNIEVGLPEEAFVITGNLQYRFANNGWNWFIEQFGDKVETKDVTDISYLAYYASELKNIPFAINMANAKAKATLAFGTCKELSEAPRIYNLAPETLGDMFTTCYMLREIPEDYCDTWDWSYMEAMTSGYGGEADNVFKDCYSLRSFPMKFFQRLNPNAVNSYSMYYGFLSGCYSIDEIVDVPFPHYNATWTSNAFNNAFQYCGRAKRITFALQEDGTPHVVNWKTQTIDLSKSIGVVYNRKYVTDYNSGITADKEVTNDDNYAALKNDPDWWTYTYDYSRYNHDSAVETINSLPDASAYLATAGGTNTIKFKGTSGSKTDGGAINTLTEEEIAVATARGWTVTLS